MKTAKQKIFFVDDEHATRITVSDVLGRAGYDVTCFSSADDCLSELERAGCNLLITDMKVSEMEGMTLLSEVRRIAPWTPVIVMSEFGDIPTAIRAIKLGAADFIEKPFDQTALLDRIREILSRSEFGNSAAALKLTKTEKKVLRLILAGNSNKEIALKKHCALRTVEFHRSNIYHKFGVDNVVELIAKAMAMFISQNGHGHSDGEEGVEPYRK